MTESKAVFLSYASQDAAAAQRIAEALRAGGIEVWLDTSELRGGDLWDQTIRRQIKDCFLFLPIVSGHTQARAEGYFRLEWRLADQRTHLMGRNRSFLVPVCVDDLPQANADVPESFSAAQWTRLPDGETPPAFVQRVKALLEAGGPVSPGQSNSGPRQTSTRGWLGLLAVAAAAIGVAVAAWVLHQRGAKGALDGPIPEKSVAVLAFADMSEKKDQEYFSDGLTEELIDLLSQLSDLRVPARTSSFYFKSRSEPISSIAQQLRVANILEGSVRKAGKRLRVTAQLIRADNGYHVWSQTYDRQDADIFAVQDDIAKAVVTALKGTLEGAAAADATRGTTNMEAYNQYLLGRQLDKQDTPDGNRHAAEAYQQAVALDPHFGAAYAGLALAELYIADDTGDSSVLEQAKQHVEQAIALSPSDARSYAARSFIRATVLWDWTGAQADAEKALSLDPRNPKVLLSYAQLMDYMGRLPEAIAAQKQATQLDPLSHGLWTELGSEYIESGDYPAAAQALHRALELEPGNRLSLFTYGTLHLMQGQHREALATFLHIDQANWLRWTGVAMAEHSLGSEKGSDEAVNQLIAKFAKVAAYQIAEVYAWRGQSNSAFEWLDRAFAQQDGGLAALRSDPLLKPIRSDPRYRAFLVKMKLPV